MKRMITVLGITATVALGQGVESDAEADNVVAGGGDQAYYIDIGTPPWGLDDYANAMDAVFGVGVWTAASVIDNVPAILADASFIYVEGSDNGAEDIKAWLTLYGDELTAWVSNGGTLFINIAPNEGGSFELPFGTMLTYPDFGTMGSAATGHPIFSGPFTPVATEYTGDDFYAHATLSGSGNELMVNESGDSILVELTGTGGRVFYGTITAPTFHDPLPESQNLLQNIISYVAFGPMVTPGTNAYFLSNSTPPWDSGDFADAMDAVFGNGNWTGATYAEEGLPIMNDASFMYLEGSDDNALELADWLIANGGALEAWVNSGGRLFINVAPNEGDEVDAPFGVTFSDQELSFDGIATDLDHPIYQGPFTPIATEYIGNAFAHSTITGAMSTIMENEDGDPILAEGAAAAEGMVFYGGLTAPQFHLPQPASQNLLQNTIVYVSGEEGGCYPDCDGDGELTILDFVCFQNLFSSGDAAADCNGDGALNILDFVCYQDAFVAGCP